MLGVPLTRAGRGTLADGMRRAQPRRMTKRNGNGGATHLLADLVADVGDLKAEQSRMSDVIDELAEVVARLAAGSRRLEQRLAKMARTVIAFAALPSPAGGRGSG